MQKNQILSLAKNIIRKDDWINIIPRFISVLRINVFIIDAEGGVVLPPIPNKHGSKILTDPKLGSDLLVKSENLIHLIMYLHQPYLS